MANTPRLGYPLIATGEQQGYVTANEDTKQNDALVQPSVLDSALATPPGAPDEGDCYIIATSPTGAWAGHANAITEYIGAVWLFYPPTAGWMAYDQNLGAMLLFDGVNWVPFFGSGSTFTTIALTSGSPTVLLTIPLAAGVAKGGKLEFWIEALDGTDLISDMNVAYWATTNKAGTYAHTLSELGGAQVTSAADTLTYVFDWVDGTNQVQLRITPTLTGMTPSTFQITFQSLIYS